MSWVPVQKLSQAWDECAPWIEAAIPYGLGDETISDILIALAQQRYILWYEPGEFAVVVSISECARKKVATLAYAGGRSGSLPAIVSTFKSIPEEFKRLGVGAFRFLGRQDWAKPLGVVPVSLLYEVNVS